MTRSGVERAVRVWQRRLGLERWSLDVVVSDEPTDALASVSPSVQYESAEVTFASVLRPCELDRTVVHELLHLLLRDVDAVVEDARAQLHPEASAQVEKRYEHVIEGFVDRLACRLVEIGGAV